MPGFGPGGVEPSKVSIQSAAVFVSTALTILEIGWPLATLATEGLKAGADNQYVPHIPDVLVNTKLLQPGEKTEITFPAPEKGNYAFICTYPGHYIRMRGSFIVQ